MQDITRAEFKVYYYQEFTPGDWVPNGYVDFEQYGVRQLPDDLSLFESRYGYLRKMIYHRDIKKLKKYDSDAYHCKLDNNEWTREKF